MATLQALYQAQPGWAWTGVAAALLALEVATGSGYLLWPSACALLTAGAVVLGLPFGLAGQIALFAILTVVTTLAARRIWPPGAHDARAPDINAAAARLVGHEGDAVAAAEPRVFVDGKEWAAEYEDGAAAQVPGGRVRVVAVLGGARLKVRPV